NYGLNKVRFVSPVPSGSRVRARIVAGSFDEVGGGAIQITWNITVERERSEKPACVAEWIVRYYPSGD
ncbi:MAG: MaoC family dehydratase, partial [Acidobacteria bacterium]|nr:MaoC family dehydratase [Acidobacteriota bacterium]